MSYISVASSYDDDDASDLDIEGMGFDVPDDDGRTPLDRTIDRIGMGELRSTRAHPILHKILSPWPAPRELPVDAPLSLRLR